MRFIVLALALSVFHANATSQFSAGKSFAISGFGTIGATDIESNDRYLTDYDTDQKNDLSYTRKSLLGLNITSELNETARLVLQTIMQGADSDFQPKLDLAFLKWEAFSNFSFLAGRLVSPTWMFSEEQSIGYTNLWLEPPNLLYSMVPFRNIDGGGIRFNQAISSTLLKLQVVGGSGRYSSTDHPTGSTLTTNIKLSDILAAELRVERGPALSLRLGYVQAHVLFDTSVELNGVIPAGPLGSINARLNTPGEIHGAHMYSLGANGQLSSLIYAAEAVQIESKSSMLEMYRADYFTLGYELGAWTPHFTASWLWGSRGGFFQTHELDGFRTGTESFTAGLNYTGLDNIVLKVGANSTTEQFTGRKDNAFSQYFFSANMVF